MYFLYPKLTKMATVAILINATYTFLFFINC